MADNLPANTTPAAPAKTGGGGQTFGSASSVFAPFMRTDIALAAAVIAIISFMLVPIPAGLLDAGLAISITFSVLILMLVLFIQSPLEFSTFPTVLLVATSLRLGLNVASTRLILENGHEGNAAAGGVIQAFGTFIIKDSYVIGAIVFAILVIVNFVVITKGSGRIAEVAARFALDAMPGKQMAIDSDLSSGLITEDEAKTRRVVSVGAGLLVSKAGVEGSADQALFDQFGRYPRALIMSSGLMAMLGFMPAIPAIPFLTLAAITGGMGYMAMKRDKVEETKAVEDAAIAAGGGPAAKPAEEPISKALAMDTIRLELGYGLLPLVQGDGENKLTDQIKGLRRQLAEDMGYVLPAVRIQDNLQLPANSYTMRIKEIESGRGDVRPGMLMCMDPTGASIGLPGESTTEPTFGLPAMWIDDQYREEAHFKGYTVVDAPTVITTHLTEIIKDNMPDLMNYAETQKLLDELPQEYQKLVSDVIPSQVSVGGLQRVLQTLLSERVSVRDLAAILEGIAEAAGYTKNTGLITEHVRTRLSRQICDTNTNQNGNVPLVTLSPEWEQAFAESLVGDGEEKQLAMAPSRLQEFIAAVREVFDDMAETGEVPALLTSPAIRPYVRSVIERFRPQTVVLSQNEIHPKARNVASLSHAPTN